MRKFIVFIMMVLMFGLSGTSFAQGIQTGTIRGIVKDQQGLPVPGVTVMATSVVLQGPRRTMSDVGGLFTLSALPAGDYTLRFELSGFATIERNTTLPLGLTIVQDVSMQVEGVSAVVEVVAQTPAPIATPVIGSNFRQSEIEALANPRTLQGTAQLSPGLTENSPNVRQLVINGAFAFDNVFMINGVDINDNLTAQPNFLFIEEAIQETQVLTSGISAEYGRFTGGVINAITKSGGNRYAGSFRINFLNPAWTDETPFEKSKNIQRLNNLQEIYETTFGGPLVRDRLWFFSAGRYVNTVASKTLPTTGIPYSQPDKNKRGEIKLTGTVAPNHTIQGGYLNNSEDIKNTGGAVSLLIDRASLDNESRPNWYYFTNYRGVVGRNLLAEVQYSERRYQFKGLGGTSAKLVDSPFLSLSLGPPFPSVYNAPLGDPTDPEKRNNRQVTGSLTGYWNKAGRHELKGGYEFYRSQRTGTGSLSSTQYAFIADYATNASGSPVLDSAGRLSPVFTSDESLLLFLPGTRGPVMNTDTNSLYVQDRWAINDRWSADVGARYEHVKAESTGNIVSVNNNRIVPRLAAAYDVRGNGNHIIHATYGQYSGRYDENQIGANSPVGHTGEIDYVYLGPAGQGRSFAPGFDLSNYEVIAASSPTANVFMDPDLKSPLLHEFTTSYGVNLWSGRGYAEAGYVYRKTTKLIEDFIRIGGGTTHVIVAGVDGGFATNQRFQNTDQAHRDYHGMVFQSRYRLRKNWSVTGHYTLQIRNNGNYEGEAANQPGQTSIIGNYPEAFNATRNFPDGRLQDFQRHRLRIWSVYDFAMGRYGDLSVSGLWRVNSGRVFSLTATVPLTAIQSALLENAGYPDESASQKVFFGDRGSQNFRGYGLFDTSINYNIPVFQSLRPWVKFDLFNLFNNEKLISWNTTVTRDQASPKDSLGLATGFVRGASFGQATATSNFPAPFGVDDASGTTAASGGRTFRVAIGFRF